LSNRAATTFGLLILAQAAHSIEEYAGRLWESFPPARFVSGLVSDDLRLGFLVLNVALVLSASGAICGPCRAGGVVPVPSR
jgi:hypothetical protein